jgi:hypothetical protein
MVDQILAAIRSAAAKVISHFGWETPELLKLQELFTGDPVQYENQLLDAQAQRVRDKAADGHAGSILAFLNPPPHAV